MSRKKRRKMLWSDKSCDMISMQDEVREQSRNRARATKRKKEEEKKVKTSQCIVTYAILAGSVSARFCLNYLDSVGSSGVLGVRKVKMSTVTTETK